MKRLAQVPPANLGLHSRPFILAVIGALLLLPAKGFSQGPGEATGCDSLGNKMVIPTINLFCTDPDNGLHVNYGRQGPWELYSPTGTLITTFFGFTIQNLDADICGPPDTPNVIAYATDGSGDYVSVTDYIVWQYVYDSNGNVLYGPFGACPV